MNFAKHTICSALLLSLVAVSCGGSTTAASNKPFDVMLHATSDDGEPVEGVAFTSGALRIGDSDAKGSLAATVRGFEGQSIPIGVRCPDGFIGPEQPTTLRLTEVRRVDANAQSSLSMEITCTRKLRDVVVVVRASNAPSLPVDVGGKTVGATDERGNAHVRLQVDREVRSVSVNLGTKDAPALRPQNPTRVFELDGRDAMLLFDQSFTVERKPVVKRRVATTVPVGKHVPYKLDSGRSYGR